MPNQIAMKITAEPRSGSAKTRKVGTAASASEVSTTRSWPICSCRSARYFASVMMITSFAISDGCTGVPAISIQRRDP